MCVRCVDSLWEIIDTPFFISAYSFGVQILYAPIAAYSFGVQILYAPTAAYSFDIQILYAPTVAYSFGR